MKTFVLSSITFLVLLSSASIALASTGTIDPTNHYAWSDNGGWVNWYATGGNVQVTDTALTGYIWSAGFGWINLAPTNGGVLNTGGYLSGYAWGASTGWISFLGVTIDQQGVFHGHTVAQNIFGTMTFDCDNCKVTTTWRQGSTNTNTGGGGTVSGPLAVGYTNPSTGSSQATTSTKPLPPTLIPTSKPSTIPQPTSKPPSSSKSPTYTTQTPLVPVFPTNNVKTNTKGGNATPPFTPASVAPSCTWLTCWWQSIIGFFARLFGR
ncbi:MAG TPA: hypothetical protein VMR46_00085 [Candidatus Paceibacterota bacterium]|nr:hypothetical protein [Candidatus Paceibacterota bacterium]